MTLAGFCSPRQFVSCLDAHSRRHLFHGVTRFAYAHYLFLKYNPFLVFSSVWSSYSKCSRLCGYVSRHSVFYHRISGRLLRLCQNIWSTTAATTRSESWDSNGGILQYNIWPGWCWSCDHIVQWKYRSYWYNKGRQNFLNIFILNHYLLLTFYNFYPHCPFESSLEVLILDIHI